MQFFLLHGNFPILTFFLPELEIPRSTTSISQEKAPLFPEKNLLYFDANFWITWTLVDFDYFVASSFHLTTSISREKAPIF